MREPAVYISTVVRRLFMIVSVIFGDTDFFCYFCVTDVNQMLRITDYGNKRTDNPTGLSL